MKAQLATSYPSILRTGGCCPNPKGTNAQLPDLHAYPQGPPLEGAGDSRVRQAQTGSTPPSLAFAQVAQGRRELYLTNPAWGLLCSTMNVDLTFRQMSYTDTNIAF